MSLPGEGKKYGNLYREGGFRCWMIGDRESTSRSDALLCLPGHGSIEPAADMRISVN